MPSKKLRQCTPRLIELNHRLCHAASAFYASECDRALVLTLDGSGHMRSGLVAVGEGAGLQVLRGLRFPDSLGWMYRGVTELPGFQERQEHKAQWVSTCGTPDLRGPMRRLFRADGHGLASSRPGPHGQKAGGTWTFAPRLASPFLRYVIDNLNQYIKHEDFHPFVLSVPVGRAAEFFEATPNCRFATSTGRLRPSVPALRPFTFNQGLVRLHLVEPESSPRFPAWLERFGEAAPVRILVNTSFNLCGQPLVSDPRTAVRTFHSCGSDAMLIGDFLMTK